MVHSDGKHTVGMLRPRLSVPGVRKPHRVVCPTHRHLDITGNQTLTTTRYQQEDAPPFVCQDRQDFSPQDRHVCRLPLSLSLSIPCNASTADERLLHTHTHTQSVPRPGPAERPHDRVGDVRALCVREPHLRQRDGAAPEAVLAPLCRRVPRAALPRAHAHRRPHGRLHRAHAVPHRRRAHALRTALPRVGGAPRDPADAPAPADAVPVAALARRRRRGQRIRAQHRHRAHPVGAPHALVRDPQRPPVPAHRGP